MDKCRDGTRIDKLDMSVKTQSFELENSESQKDWQLNE